MRDPLRPRRADARRNYESVLAAAKEVFDEQGVAAPLDEIARRAGVGNATMYRNFPTRRELVIAVYADEVSELCSLGESLLDDHGGERSALFERWHEAMRSTASALLSRALQSGRVRSDLDVSDLLALAHGIALTSADPAQTGRLLALVRRGVE
jgi:AcrR family transcriptional regulator